MAYSPEVARPNEQRNPPQVSAVDPADDVRTIVLFSGDGAFRSLVEAVERRGVRVAVVSTLSSQPPTIADEPRRQADVFTDLVELRSKIDRHPTERSNTS